MTGPWLGQWPGEWLGDWDGARAPAAPGNMYATIGGAGGIAANLTIATAEVIDFPVGGAFHPPRQDDPAKRRRRDDETLLVIGAL